jgi:hypothetical protein
MSLYVSIRVRAIKTLLLNGENPNLYRCYEADANLVCTDKSLRLLSYSELYYSKRH